MLFCTISALPTKFKDFWTVIDYARPNDFGGESELAAPKRRENTAAEGVMPRSAERSLDVLLPPILGCAAIARNPAVLDEPAAVALHELRVVSSLLEELRRLFYALVQDVRIDQPTGRLVAVAVDNHIRHERMDGAFVDFARLLARHAVDLFDLVTAREHHVIHVEDAVFGVVPGHFLAAHLTEIGIVSNHHVLDPNPVEQSLVGDGLVLGKARARQQKQQNGGDANDAVNGNACLHDISLMLEVRRRIL
jgi:hypothetical protein